MKNILLLIAMVLFVTPAKAQYANVGDVMNISAVVDQQIGGATMVHFFSIPLNSPAGSWPKDVGGQEGSGQLAVYGMPTDLGDNDHWSGVVYPAGMVQIGSHRYHRYATTKELAAKISATP
jgi:hypothetical protein